MISIFNSWPRRFCFIAVLLVLLGLSLSSGGSSALPLAASGVLDLRSIDLDKSGLVNLDGEWAFYPQQVLGPEVFSGEGPQASASLAPRHISLPGAWNDFDHAGLKLPDSGVATFRLQVLLGDYKNDLALRISGVHSAYRLWLNGKLIASRGVLGEQAALEKADSFVDLPVFRSDGAALDLVLQVSNHLHRSAGVISSIQLGSEPQVRGWQLKRWGISLFFFGCMLMMGVYHLIYYFLRKSSVSALYFALYCLLWGSNFVFSDASDWVVRLFFPDLPVATMQRFDSFCFFLSVPVGYTFFQSLFPEEFSRGLFRFSVFLALVFASMAVVAPIRLLVFWVPAYYLISLVLIGYSLIALFKAWRRGREAAGYILLGFLMLGLFAANDMLCDMGVIRSIYLIHVGMFFFILSQGFALSVKFASAFFYIERLSADLEARNIEMENEMARRIRLQREIINISENERRSLGHDLHDGLCQYLTAARLQCSFLKLKMNGSEGAAEEFSRLSSLLEDSVNLTYTLARGLWPVDCDDQGMSTFLDEFCRRLSTSSGIRIDVEHLRVCSTCGNEHVTQLYRIAQEAITNAIKHARASRIAVSLDCVTHAPELLLRVVDDGGGRIAGAATPGGMGMQIMAYRAQMIGGRLEVDDVPGGGTCVSCKIHCARCSNVNHRLD
jgi:signal transduction histidine kinase